MMKQLLIFVLLFSCVNSYCCDCKTISKEKEYVDSKLIFLGKIISINEKYFEIKVLEVFKGKTKEIIKSYLNDCSIYPNKGDIWLLYSNTNKENDFFISVCGNSRSFRKPFILNDANLPPPPNSNSLDQSNAENYFKIALLELQLDIVKLREIRIKNKLTDITNNYESLENQIIILRLIIILGLSFIFLFFTFRKYKFK